MSFLRFIVILCISPLSFAQINSDGDLDAGFSKTTLVVSSSRDACYRFDVYLALDAPQRQRGLMFVRHMPEFTGMLFEYRSAGTRSIWMKNTYISLDILFVHADGKIANIAQNATPLLLDSYKSAVPVHYVLELNAGMTDKLGIDENSHIFVMDVDGL